MNRKPWLRPGLTLDERIALGLASVMNQVKPEQHPSFNSMFKHRWKHVDVCRNRVNGHIRWIASIELDPATPLQKRNAILDAAKKVREAKSALTVVPWPQTKQQDEASTLERIADEIEKAADKIPAKHGGGSPEKKTDSARKSPSVECAFDLIVNWGGNIPIATTKNKAFAALAQTLFEIATGRSGDLTKEVKTFFRDHAVKPIKKWGQPGRPIKPVERTKQIKSVKRPIVVDETKLQKMRQMMQEGAVKLDAEWNQPPPD